MAVSECPRVSSAIIHRKRHMSDLPDKFMGVYINNVKI
jgi:hypothetical protein